MTRLLHFRTFLFLFVGIIANAQTIVWTGASSDNNFFTEGNWKDSVTNVIPTAGSINPATNISLVLQINNSATTITASGSIQFSTGSLALGSATVSATSLSGGNVTINEGGYLNLSAASPFLNSVQINFTSGIGWIRTPSYDANAITANNLGQIKVNNAASVYVTNLRLDNYYLNGCVIRANLVSTTPLTVYDGINSLGNSAAITVNTIHIGSAIAGSMNNKIKSFVLRRGFMATVAIEEDGTGKSKNYIASETDLVINTLDVALRNSISFIRVMPWNWVNKKGRTDIETDLNTMWVYKWNSTFTSTLDWEYVPMQWGNLASLPPSVSVINNFVNKYNSPHLLTFNEPDSCDGQSGLYPGGPNGPTVNKLCNPDVAVKHYKELMKTGMRMVSPATREGGYRTTDWLYQFITKAAAQDLRIDAIAVHWYDWGGVLDNNANNDSDAQILARFQSYIISLENAFNLPIWITEFNANPSRTLAKNAAFIASALPWLESRSSVERYAWFAYNNNTHYYGWDDTLNNGQGAQTNTTKNVVGTNFANQVSTPSIPETTVNVANNLTLGTCTNCN